MGKRIIDLTTASNLTGEEFLAVDDGSADGTTQKAELNDISDFIQNNTYGANLVAQYEFSGVGWRRVFKFNASSLSETQGSYGYGELIKINSLYNTLHSVYKLISFAAGYNQSNFLNIHSIDSQRVITKIRHTIDSINNIAYIEIYYASESANKVTLAILANTIGFFDDNFKTIAWQPTNGESTEETVDGVGIISSLDLPSGISGVGQSN